MIWHKKWHLFLFSFIVYRDWVDLEKFFFFINSSLLILIELNMNCRTPPRIGYPLVGACVRAIPTMGTRQALFPKKPEYATRMMYIWTNHVAIAPREFKQILYRNRSRKKCGCITKYNSILPVHVCCVYGAICKCVQDSPNVHRSSYETAVSQWVSMKSTVANVLN